MAYGRHNWDRSGHMISIREKPPLSRERPICGFLRDSELPTTSTRDQSSVLSRGEVEQLCQVARRLRGEMRSALDALPEPIDGPSALGELLNLDRATAHRLLQLARSGGGEFRWLQRGPGVQAIRQFAQAAHECGVDAGVTASVEAAADRYEEVINELAGSKSKLMRRLEVAESQLTRERGDVNEAGRERLRAQLFENASALIGRHMDVRIDMMIMRPSSVKKDWLECVWLRGIIGHRAGPGSPALAIGYHDFGRRDGASTRSGAQNVLAGSMEEGERRSVVLDAFSTQPPPLMVSKSASGRLMQVVDPKATAKGEAVDVVVAQRMSTAVMHPKFEARPVLELNALVREPARALLFDVYLHRELAQGALADLDLYVWSPTLEQSLADHWFDRLPTQAALQVLGRGLGRARSPLFDRHAELTRHVFDQVEWPAEQFVGYRCGVQYPMWGGAYAMTFDYSATSEQ